MNVIRLAMAILLIAPTASPAQTPDPAPAPPYTFGGFIDAAYLFAPNDPLNQVFRSRGTAWHLNDPFLNMAAAYVKKPASESSRIGTELMVQAGKDAEIFGFSATAPNLAGSDVLRHIGLANVSYMAPAGKGLTVQGGIFGSLIGYDSLWAKDNLSYTRPWGADFTPYLMLGVNASYPLTGNLTGTLYVVNGYWHLANANHVPSTGLQLVYKATPEVTIKNSTMYGPHQADTALAYWRVINDSIVERRHGRFIVAFNGHVATEQVAESGVRAWWLAAQLPLRWNVGGPWNLTLRPEVARDTVGRWTLAEQTVVAMTSTLEYRLTRSTGAGASLRLEHRFDRSTGAQGGFFSDHESRPGEIALVPNQHVFIAAAIFTFEGGK